MKRYKLVTQDYKTRKGESNETTWGIGQRVEATGAGTELCTEGVIHSYATPLLAVLLNPIHANIRNPRMLVLSGGPIVASSWGKAGHKWVTPVAEMELPAVTNSQRVAFGILCALEVYHEQEFVAWAEGWLSGRNRSFNAARAAADAADDAARAAAARAARATAYAADAARAAADAARAAAYAAADADAARAADADAADDAAAYAARAAARAAYAAVYAAGKIIDFAKLARQAMRAQS